MIRDFTCKHYVWGSFFTSTPRSACSSCEMASSTAELCPSLLIYACSFKRRPLSLVAEMRDAALYFANPILHPSSLLLHPVAKHHIHTQQRLRSLTRGTESLHHRPFAYTYYYNAHPANAPAVLGQTTAPKHTDLASRRGPSRTIPTPAQSSPVRSRNKSVTMAVERILPEDRNPMLAEERAPSRTSIFQNTRSL
jgi:hypothetical protein